MGGGGRVPVPTAREGAGRVADEGQGMGARERLHQMGHVRAISHVFIKSKPPAFGSRHVIM